MLERRTLEQDLDLVALATVADVVPLTGENRTLVRRGLRALAGTTKPGLRALMAVAGVDPGKVDERAVGFALAPRLNAAGRLYRADAGLELILTEDRRARSADRRRARRAPTTSAASSRRASASQPKRRWPSWASARPTCWPARAGTPGVIGIVASRLVERSGRPVVLIALDGDTRQGLRAQRRGVRPARRAERVRRAPAALRRPPRRRGPRDRACARAPTSRPRSCAHAERVLRPQDLVAVERVDAIVGGEELGMALAEELQSLAPFGRGNPSVSLMIADATFTDVRPMGEGKHVRFTVESRGARRAGRGLRQRRSAAGARDGRAGELDATFTLEVNEWNGVSEPRLVLRHAQPRELESEPGATPEEAQAPAEEEELVLFAL